MPLSSRQKKILALIQERKTVKVDDLALRLATTPQTIRKDLQHLADLHHVVRFHGGAALLGGVEYTSFESRRAVAKAEKESIGREVAARIPSNCAIFINAGTTTECVAHELRHASGLRILTDNVDIASKTKNYPGAQVIVPCGAVRGSDGSILGAETVDFIRQFRVDFAIIGAAALGEDGTLLDYDLQEVQVCRAIMSSARHVILAIDSGKFGRTASVRLGHLADVHTLVTDAGVADWVRRLCREHDVDIAVEGAAPRVAAAVGA